MNLLHGLSLAPSQVWGGIRLVPVLRPNAPGDLRIREQRYNDYQFTAVKLDENDLHYCSYIPHGLILEWNNRGEPVATYGTHLQKRIKTKDKPQGVRLMHRMAKREDRNRLRLLPLHLAMEGFLSLHFGGPSVAWKEYSQQAISHGLSPRHERVIAGRAILGLSDALRVFEIHEDQVGVLVFVADALASAAIVSHPFDYRQLHATVIEDFYGELIEQYSLYASCSTMKVELDDSKIHSLRDLTRAFSKVRDAWAEFHGFMAEGLIGRELDMKAVYKAGRFQLSRFITKLDLGDENHIGEVITRDDGTIEYLKTFRLSGSQTRRAYLLSRLAANDFNLDATAKAEGQSKGELVLRLQNAGFGYLLKKGVLQAARR